MEAEREYHGIPLWAISGYLVELGGTMIREDYVGGEGWSATLRQGEPFTPGAIRFETVYIHFKGDATVLKRVLATFDLKMIRAGG
jgi:hypothetical protein